MNYIQIFGLQCSGTNILHTLCKKNFSVTVGESYGSKHGVKDSIQWDKIKRDRDNVLFVYIQKNVYAWIISMRNSPHRCFPNGLSIKKVMQHKYYASNVFKFPNILEMRKCVIDTIVDVKNISANWLSISHIDLIKDPLSMLNKIKQYVPANSFDLSPLSKYKGHSGKFIRNRYYIDEMYMKMFDKECKDILNNLYDMNYEAKLM